MIDHPHFARTLSAIDGRFIYRSLATGATVRLDTERNEVIARYVLPDGSPLPVHSDPAGWGADEWDALDHVHAQR
jgi:hypothetical protein